MRLPEKFEDRMKKMLGDEYDDFINSSYLSVEGDQIALRSDGLRNNNRQLLVDDPDAAPVDRNE